MTDRRYIRALNFRWLTPFFDLLVEGPLSVLKIRRDLVAQAGVLNGLKVLDVGCGTGTLAVMVKKANPKAEVVGLDGDPQILQIARAKAGTHQLSLRFDRGMSFALPYPDESFDVVLFSFMLHHLSREDKQRTAHEAYRVLRPNGRLIGADLTEARSFVGRSMRPFVRHIERMEDNVFGFLPVMFETAGFKDYAEPRRYLFETISLFQGSKNAG